MLRLENVGLAYDGGAEVLRGVSFAMRPGDFRFLTGPSGAGKTSLIRMLFAALKPTSGRLSLFGQDVTSLAKRELPHLRRRIGVVFQEFRLLEHLSVFDNVALPLRVAGRRAADYQRDVMDLLEWVGLGKHADCNVETLSGGEQQRVAIARAVIGQPELLLADEPTGNVDPALARKLLHLFAELNRQGTTVLLATHDKSLLKQLRAPVLHLEAGRVTEV